MGAKFKRLICAPWVYKSFFGSRNTRPVNAKPFQIKNSYEEGCFRIGQKTYTCYKCKAIEKGQESKKYVKLSRPLKA